MNTTNTAPEPKTYQLEPLNKTPLSTQIDRIYPNVHKGSYWSEFIRFETHYINPDTGDKLIFATPEQEQQAKEDMKQEEARRQEARANKYNHIKGIFLHVDNHKQWSEGIKELNKPERPTVEISEESYDYFLNVLPPLKWIGNTFIVREANRTNAKGQNIYTVCTMIQGRYFAQQGTVQEYNENKLFKNL